MKAPISGAWGRVIWKQYISLKRVYANELINAYFTFKSIKYNNPFMMCLLLFCNSTYIYIFIIYGQESTYFMCNRIQLYRFYAKDWLAAYRSINYCYHYHYYHHYHYYYHHYYHYNCYCHYHYHHHHHHHHLRYRHRHRHCHCHCYCYHCYCYCHYHYHNHDHYHRHHHYHYHHYHYHYHYYYYYYYYWYY